MYAVFSSSTAEQDWGEWPVTLPGDVNTRKWPPQCWRNLLSHQRRLQWEFIAFQYEQSSGRVSRLDRAGLLDTYNTIKSRYYLYESILYATVNHGGKETQFKYFYYAGESNCLTRSHNGSHLQSFRRRQNSPSDLMTKCWTLITHSNFCKIYEHYLNTKLSGLWPVTVTTVLEESVIWSNEITVGIHSIPVWAVIR